MISHHASSCLNPWFNVITVWTTWFSHDASANMSSSDLEPHLLLLWLMTPWLRLDLHFSPQSVGSSLLTFDQCISELTLDRLPTGWSCADQVSTEYWSRCQLRVLTDTQPWGSLVHVPNLLLIYHVPEKKSVEGSMGLPNENSISPSLWLFIPQMAAYMDRLKLTECTVVYINVHN